ncbi:MAG: hypothetical protein LBE24_10685 [Methylobacillus sp.]|jgi:hypothetical protein|nr:hypothetical protein [Methylobacillus sp.]
MSTRHIAGIEYHIRELTMTDIRQWLRDIELAVVDELIPIKTRWWRTLLARVGLARKPLPAVTRDVVDLMLFDEFVLFDLRYLTDLTESQIANLTPRQVREIWAECEKVNADFFQFRGRLETLGMASPQIFAEALNGRSHS